MASKVPATFRKYVAHKMSSKFREAVDLVTTKTPELGKGEVLVKNRYVGINASDINYTAGRYDPKLKPPFDVGFEGVGEVVAVGQNCSLSVGQAVGYMKYGSFSEYIVIPDDWALPLPNIKIKPEIVSLMVSGLTAAISMDKLGELKAGETVLVTAAAGGTGQFAVQLAKIAGCHVVGTCSNEEKVEFLKKIGCDRVINYNKEDLRSVLRKEYRKGVNVVYECVGGETFDICLDSLAQRGRLIVIGMISGYENQSAFKPSHSAPVTIKLLTKSASLRGFYLFSFFEDFSGYLLKLAQLQSEGKLKVGVDNGKFSPTGKFVGIESVPDAIDYMYSRKNVGKVVVEMGTPTSNL